ncbi:MAG: aldo/keto reductase [Trueperaceae bacterium]|nr:aldo/keto reductase [Trueperaceae bacterium]
MERRPFGNTGMELPEICFGTMRFAAKTPGDDAQTRAGQRALEEALDLGVDFVHSSYEYGTRWSTSQVLARHPHRDRVRHAIKVNVPDWGEPGFDPAVFRRQIEDALRDLRAERIDVVQHLQRGDFERLLGYDDRAEPQRVAELDAVLEPLREVAQQLRDEGLIGALTTFPYTVGYARAAIASGAFDGIVAYFNWLETEMVEVFDLMRAQGMGFIGIRPLMGGLLTDARIDRSALPAGDRMLDPGWDRAYDQLAEARAIVAPEIGEGRTAPSWTSFALKFSLVDPLIASTVVSINTPEQLHEVLAALEGPRPDPALLPRLHQITARFRAEHGVRADGAGVPQYER